MSPYYSDDHVTLWHGDAAATLAGFPDRSVDCIVTSPPYFGLRDYGVDGQLGAEATPGQFVASLVDVFHEAQRVLTNDGTLWLNLGDSYAASGGHTDPGRSSALQGRRVQLMQNLPAKGADRPRKNLLGIPWRTAFALQDDGWILRNEIVWAKPNAMPESVKDRLSNRHEKLFLFSRRGDYWFDLEPIREPTTSASRPRPMSGQNLTQRHAAATDNTGWKDRLVTAHEAGRNPGDVWTIPTTPFPGAHFATFPIELARRCIVAGCKPGGTVLDPFSGSGTTGLAATQSGRDYVGIDLNVEYLDLSLRTRLRQGVLDLGA